MLNATMKNSHLSKYCNLDPKIMKILNSAVGKFDMSARSYFKTLKVARTIADLDMTNEVSEKHLVEALQYRNFSGE
jgi:magnesium chelatase family protein